MWTVSHLQLYCNAHFFPASSSCSDFCSDVTLLIQFWGQQCVLWPSFHDRYKECVNVSVFHFYSCYNTMLYRSHWYIRLSWFLFQFIILNLRIWRNFNTYLLILQTDKLFHAEYLTPLASRTLRLLLADLWWVCVV